MNFGEGERRRTIHASSENLTKSTEIAAFWRVRTQSPVANRVVANLINRRKNRNKGHGIMPVRAIIN